MVPLTEPKANGRLWSATKEDPCRTTCAQIAHDLVASPQSSAPPDAQDNRSAPALDVGMPHAAYAACYPQRSSHPGRRIPDPAASRLLRLRPIQRASDELKKLLRSKRLLKKCQLVMQKGLGVGCIGEITRYEEGFDARNGLL